MLLKQTVNYPVIYLIISSKSPCPIRIFIMTHFEGIIYLKYVLYLHVHFYPVSNQNFQASKIVYFLNFAMMYLEIAAYIIRALIAILDCKIKDKLQLSILLLTPLRWASYYRIFKHLSLIMTKGYLTNLIWKWLWLNKLKCSVQNYWYNLSKILSFLTPRYICAIHIAQALSTFANH